MQQSHPLTTVVALVLVAIGGFAGSNLRFLFDIVVPSTLVATLSVNVLGCAALGFFLYEGRYSGIISERTHLVLLTGFISSFTTYSTFVMDAITTSPALGLSYVVATYAFGFGAVLVGRTGAQKVAARPNGEAPGKAKVDAEERAEGATTVLDDNRDRTEGS